MKAAAELRKQIESALAGRIPAALSPRPLRSPELVSCGVAEVDSLLGGGLPLGTIVELTLAQQANGDLIATASSGRTTLALSALAGLTRQGHCCAYVDACDTLDPLSAAALGVELRRLLWVRPPEQNFVNTKSQKLKAPHTSPLWGNVGRTRSAQFNSYLRLDRALRATDLLLNAGSWSAVVLDLAELPAAQARRVPLATWYRFRLQAEKSRALLLLLTPIACANSCAAISLHGDKTKAEWRRAAIGVPGAPSFGVLGWENSPSLLAELHHRMSVSRSRRAEASIDKSSVPKKPPVSSFANDLRMHDQTWWTSTLAWPG